MSDNESSSQEASSSPLSESPEHQSEIATRNCGDCGNSYSFRLISMWNSSNIWAKAGFGAAALVLGLGVGYGGQLLYTRYMRSSE